MAPGPRDLPARAGSAPRELMSSLSQGRMARLVAYRGRTPKEHIGVATPARSSPAVRVGRSGRAARLGDRSMFGPCARAGIAFPNACVSGAIFALNAGNDNKSSWRKTFQDSVENNRE